MAKDKLQGKGPVRRVAGIQQPVSVSTPARQIARDGEEETLAVLEDLDTGVEYYMEIIDQFPFEGRTYVAMFPLPDKRSGRRPALVLMRVVSGDGRPGTTEYESIRDRRQLNRVFDAFFARYERSGG